MIISSNSASDHCKMNQQQHKPIAPKNGFRNGNQAAAATGSELVTSTSSHRPTAATAASCRRRIAFHPTLGYAITPTVPAKVARRNARERNRVKQVNCGFEILRSHIPSAAKSKKMSKVDTLKHAVDYIQTMQKMLHEQHHHQQQTHLPPPLLIQPPTTPLTPTSSSRASSIPSPMTPHIQGHQYQQHHFILPDVPPYPSPLTPRTPNTPMSSEFISMSSGNHFPSNDSGYETSSYYSSSSPVVGHCHPGRQQHLQHQQMMTSGHQLDSSPVSPPVFHRYNDMDAVAVAAAAAAAVNHFQYSSDFGGIAENPEEEELLDAIAKWQEQTDE